MNQSPHSTISLVLDGYRRDERQAHSARMVYTVKNEELGPDEHVEARKMILRGWAFFVILLLGSTATWAFLGNRQERLEAT